MSRKLCSLTLQDSSQSLVENIQTVKHTIHNVTISNYTEVYYLVYIIPNEQDNTKALIHIQGTLAY